MSNDEQPSLQDPAGMTSIYPCTSCQRDTTHTILAIVNSRDFEGKYLVQFLNHYLTVKCNGCGTVGFCHISKCTEEEDYDDQGRPFLVSRKKRYPEIHRASEGSTEAFLNADRLGELAALPKTKYDIARLAQMLAELDRAYRNHSYLSCIFLIRAILDHIPPIFGLKSFAEIANNYAGGGKSFRESMRHLDNASRKIADSHLHSQIRTQETVPNKTQVEFRADMDVLIGEVVRILHA